MLEDYAKSILKWGLNILFLIVSILVVVIFSLPFWVFVVGVLLEVIVNFAIYLSGDRQKVQIKKLNDWDEAANVMNHHPVALDEVLDFHGHVVPNNKYDLFVGRIEVRKKSALTPITFIGLMPFDGKNAVVYDERRMGGAAYTERLMNSMSPNPEIGEEIVDRSTAFGSERILKKLRKDVQELKKPQLGAPEQPKTENKVAVQ